MRPFLLFVSLIVACHCGSAQTLDTLEALLRSGRVVDAKLYIDGLNDSVYQTNTRYQLLKGELYLVLYQTSLGQFGIKSNNWLATGCNAYVQGITELAKSTRIPDSLFAITKKCYESSIAEAVAEQTDGSLVLADELFYTGHYSATLWTLLSGLAVKDTFALYHLGMYYYQQGNIAIDETTKHNHYQRAKYYFDPLRVGKKEDVLEALAVLEDYLK